MILVFADPDPVSRQAPGYGSAIFPGSVSIQLISVDTAWIGYILFLLLLKPFI